MTEPPHGILARDSTANFVATVARRMRLVQAARRISAAWWWLGGVALAVVVVGRLTGVGSTWLIPAAASVPVVVAMLIGVFSVRTPALRIAARRADAALSSGDLMLTATTLSPHAGGLASVVAEQAAQRAAVADPCAVVPWRPWTRLGWSLLLGVALLTTLVWMPQADPFGLAQRDALLAQRRQLIEDARAAAVATAAEIAARKPQAELSQAAERSITALLAALPKAGSGPRDERLRAIDAERKRLSEQLDGLNTARMSEADPGMQRVGADAGNAAELRKALERGDAVPAQRAAAAAMAAAKRLAEAKSPAERAAAERELRDRLADLQQAAKGSPAAAQALADAAERLADAADPAVAAAALDALGSDLALADVALAQDAQSGRDRKALREALETLRLARAAATSSSNDTPARAKPSLAEYREMYRQMLAQAGQGHEGQGGDGMGEGRGTGATRPEDPDAKTAHMSEQSPSVTTPGKIVAKWKAPGASESGAVIEAYRTQLEQARQAASDAIQSEDLPAAYHDAARRYFDELNDARPKP